MLSAFIVFNFSIKNVYGHELLYNYPDIKKKNEIKAQVDNVIEQSKPSIDKIIDNIIINGHDIIYITNEINAVRQVMEQLQQMKGRVDKNISAEDAGKIVGTTYMNLIISSILISTMKDNIRIVPEYNDFIQYTSFLNSEFRKAYSTFKQHKKETAIADLHTYMGDILIEYAEKSYQNHPNRAPRGNSDARGSIPHNSLHDRLPDTFQPPSQSGSNSTNLPHQKQKRENTLRGEVPVEIRVRRMGMAGTNYSGVDLFITSKITDLEVSLVDITPKECNSDYVQRGLTGKYKQGHQKTAILSCGTVQAVYFETNKGSFTVD